MNRYEDLDRSESDSSSKSHRGKVSSVTCIHEIDLTLFVQNHFVNILILKTACNAILYKSGEMQQMGM